MTLAKRLLCENSEIVNSLRITEKITRTELHVSEAVMPYGGALVSKGAVSFTKERLT